MAFGGVHYFTEVDAIAKKYPDFQTGCLVDTNILISASLPMDPFNEQAEALVNKLSALDIPLYTNVNIRAEFLEVYRRILIPESLCDFLEDAEENLNEVIVPKLRSVQTSYRKALDSGKIYKFSDDRIKEFRGLLSTGPGNETGWEIFCQTYLHPQVARVWDDVTDQCRLRHLKLRESEAHPLITGPVSWEGAVDIMGNFGLGSADSMILNLFMNSKMQFLITSDGDLKSVAPFLKENQKEIISLI